MFDFLKKKISTFVDTLVGKAEEAQKPQVQQPAAQEKEVIISNEREQVATVETVALKPVEKVSPAEVAQAKVPPAKQLFEEEKVPVVVQRKPPILQAPVASVPVALDAPVEKFLEKSLQKPTELQVGTALFEQLPKPVENKPQVPALKQVQKQVEKPREIVADKPVEKKPEIELKPKLGLLSRIKSVFSPEIEISEAELKPVLEQLEVALLESDVSFDATQHFLKELSTRLSGKKVKSGSAGEEIKAQVKESLLSLFVAKPFDLYNYVTALKNDGKVGVILFVGPNGSGKTTTIAKLSKQFSDRGVSCVIAAGDTFRKAAIEQAKVHGERLGVRVVSHQYGADPTAVAFDAVAHAKANGKQVVLVDTAGRQETNLNLVREMEKMDRVLKPDLKIFVGEAIAGNALASQASEFNKAIKLDGIVLTKLDCDAKGGGAFSIAFETKLPILFIGVGQEYDDLRPFEPEWLCNSVLAA